MHVFFRTEGQMWELRVSNPTDMADIGDVLFYHTE